jgi:DtxR family Mn-dependent transcriptional regulator
MQDSLIALLAGLAVVGGLFAFFWPEKGLLARWRRIRLLTSRVLHEDALKHIQKQDLNRRPASLQSVAGALGLDSNRAVQLVADLEGQGLIRHDEDGLRLTHEGRQVAMNVIRAHRLWEQYLAENTGFSQSEWHPMADQYEHQFSSEELDALAGSLGNPLFDPHGDPIPSREGQVFEHNAVPLTALEQDQSGRIVHVGDEPEMVAAQINAEGLLPGMLLHVSEKTTNRIRFWTNGEEHILAPVVAASISVQLLEEERESRPVGTATYLHELAQGQTGRVVQLLPRLRGAERRRLLDLGMLPGTLVRAELRSPVGDPVAYRVRGALIALRHDQARHIQVNLIKEEA